MIDDLLSVADELAIRDPGKPRKASLKRAVSSAYYALFHALCEMCAKELVGNYKPWDSFRLMYRSLDHQTAKKILRQEISATASPAVAKIVATFGTLQEERHTADYDPSPTLTRGDAIRLTADARKAVELIRTLPGADRKRLAVRLIAKTR